MTLQYSNEQFFNSMNPNLFTSDVNNNFSSGPKDENLDKNKLNMLNLLSSNNIGNINNQLDDALLDTQLQQQRRLSLLANSNSNSCNNQDLASMDTEFGAELMNMMMMERRRSSMLGSSSVDDNSILTGGDNALATLANKLRRNSMLGTSLNINSFDNLTAQTAQGSMMGSNQNNHIRDTNVNIINSNGNNSQQQGDVGSRSDAVTGLKNNDGNQWDVSSELQMFLQQKLQQDEELRAAMTNEGTLMDGNAGTGNGEQHEQQQQQMRRLSLIAAMNTLGPNTNESTAQRRNSLASLICGDDFTRRASLLLGNNQGRMSDFLGGFGISSSRRSSLSFLNTLNRRDSLAGSTSSRRNSMLGSTIGQYSRNDSLIGSIGAGESFLPRNPHRRGSLLPIDPNEMEGLFEDSATGSTVLGQNNLATLQMQLQELQQAQILLASNKNANIGNNNLTIAAAEALRRLSNASESAFQNKSNLAKPSHSSSSINASSEDDNNKGGLGTQFNEALNNINTLNDSNKEVLSQGVDSNIAATTTEIFKAFSHSMNKSQISQKNIQLWDKKMGLKKSHSITMTKTTQSRKMLREMFEQQLRIMFGVIIDLSGKEEMGEIKIKKKRGRKKGSKNKKKVVKRDSCSTASSVDSNNNGQDENNNFADDEHEDSNEMKQDNSTNIDDDLDENDSNKSKRRRMSDTSEMEDHSVTSQREKTIHNMQLLACSDNIEGNAVDSAESRPQSILLPVENKVSDRDIGEVSYENLNVPWRKGEISRLNSLSVVASCLEEAEGKFKHSDDLKKSSLKMSSMQEIKADDGIYANQSESETDFK